MVLNSDSLSNLNLTEGETLIMKIKAAMYSGGDIQEYIRSLILSDKRTVPGYESYCTTCQDVKHMVSVKDDEEFNLSTLSNKRIVVESVPKHKCISCGSVKTNVKLSEAIEEVLETQFHKTATIPFEALVS